MLALIAGVAVFQAVVSGQLGDGTTEATTVQGPGVGYTSPAPALPTYQPAGLFPDAGGTILPASGKWSPPEHDALTAYVLDPGFTLPAVSSNPAPAPIPNVQSAQGALTEAEARAVLTEAGWPIELHDQALAVACGIGNRSGFTSGESGCRPGAVGDGGNSLGFFQLWYGWARYCGIPIDALLDALENARCAYRVYLYDIEKGYGAWKQWTVKP